MNKQEALKKLEEVSKAGCTRWVVYDEAKELIEQIDELEKPVIPKFAAETLEECKKCDEPELYRALEENPNEWFDVPANQELFARAWLDGYEVEREKLYTVELPNPNGKSPIRKYGLVKNDDHNVVIGFIERLHQFTESEIRKDFEWAWQFAKEVE